MNFNTVYYILRNHNISCEVQRTIQIFYPNCHYYNIDEFKDKGFLVESILYSDAYISEAVIYEDGQEIYRFSYKFTADDDKRRIIMKPIFEALKHLTGYTPPWGMITGIRPAKTANDLIDSGKSKDEVFNFFTLDYSVNSKKAELAIYLAEKEKSMLKNSLQNSIALYIGIPFCPTRCLYCSFAAYTLIQYKNKVDEYLDLLFKELDFLSEYSKKYKLESIYIGGGTPTALDEIQLEKLLKAVKSKFDFKNISEFTVEAGRPDTVNKNKLMLLKEYGTSRISINPQTMNQKTLDLIGRQHTVENTVNAFYMARELGHNNINMDLILGLPEETEKDVKNTFNEIYKLSPENITVHTLAVKRASRLKEKLDEYSLTDVKLMEKILDISYEYAKKMNMKPYYMYRQKNMLGSFENIGYCKEGFESIYNIKIMEECQTILGAGVGATTKIVVNENIQRVFNVKSIEEYTSRLEEMIIRKRHKLP